MSSEFVKKFWDLFENVTRSDQLEQNQSFVVKIINSINNNEVNPEDVVLKTFYKINNSIDLHSCYYSLKLLETMIKKCGSIKNIVSANDDLIVALKKTSKRDSKINDLSKNILQNLQIMNNNEKPMENFQSMLAEVMKLKKEEYYKNKNSLKESEFDYNKVQAQVQVQSHLSSEKSKSLPKELLKVKKERLNVTGQLTELRKQISNEYSANNCTQELQRCKRNCSECHARNEISNKAKEEVKIEHQIPKELRKIKELRKNVKSDIIKLREEKQNFYYSSKK